MGVISFYARILEKVIDTWSKTRIVYTVPSNVLLVKVGKCQMTQVDQDQTCCKPELQSFEQVWFGYTGDICSHFKVCHL